MCDTGVTQKIYPKVQRRGGEEEKRRGGEEGMRRQLTRRGEEIRRVLAMRVPDIPEVKRSGTEVEREKGEEWRRGSK